jgi:hypothetical protein
MPNQNTDTEEKLQKLGERLRAGHAKQHPAQNLDTVRAAVREQYEQEQKTEREKKSTPKLGKGQERSPPEPDQERE